MGPDVFGDPVDDLAELFGGGHRREFGPRKFDGDVQPPGVTAVDDGGRPSGADAGEKPGRLFDGPLGGREADPLGPGTGLEVFEALQGEGQVGTPLVPGQGVDLVHDHRLHLAERRPASGRGDQEIETFRRRHQEGRRVLDHGGPGSGGGVAGADGHRDRGDGQAQGGRLLGDLGQGALEVLVDVDGQGLQGRDIDQAGGPRDQVTGVVGPVGGVDGHQESGEGLARSGGGGDQGVPARSDQGPALGLRLRGPVGEAAAEPRGHGRVEALQGPGGLSFCRAHPAQGTGEV